MASTLTAYLAGIGTVVAALTVGFSGGLWLAESSAVREPSAAYAGRFNRPHIERETQQNRVLMTPPPVVAASPVPSEQMQRGGLAETDGESNTEAREKSAATIKEAVRTRAAEAREFERRRANAERRKRLAELKKKKAIARLKIQRQDRDDADYEPRHYDRGSQRVGLFGPRSGFGFFGD